MQVYIVCQPDAETNHWSALYLRGLRAEAKRKGYDIELLSLEVAAERFTKAPPRCAVILATSRIWIAMAAETLTNLDVAPIIVGNPSRDGYRHASFVYMDYREATYQLVDYLRAYGKERIALFAVNSDSSPDMIKKDAFLACANCRESDIFYYTGAAGMFTATCKNFADVCRNYDAVLCANDAGAIILMHQLEEAGVKVPDDLFLCAFGDMEISASGKKTLTMARLDCEEIGRQAIAVVRMLSGSKNISGINTKVRCEIAVGETTASLPLLPFAPDANAKEDGEPSRFADDPTVSRIFLAEKVLSACDAIDMDLLRLIIKGYKYFDIAEILHVSESTIKYRLKRLLQIGELPSREELVGVMEKFLK